MPMSIKPDRCPCCANVLHHCESCWDEHHNGKRDNDYEPPKYYGEPMFSYFEWLESDEDLSVRLAKGGFELMKEQGIEPDRDRLYIEGEYNHDTPKQSKKSQFSEVLEEVLNDDSLRARKDRRIKQLKAPQKDRSKIIL